MKGLMYYVDLLQGYFESMYAVPDESEEAPVEGMNVVTNLGFVASEENNLLSGDQNVVLEDSVQDEDEEPMFI